MTCIVDCAEIERLIAGNRVTGADMAAHLAGCPACSSLVSEGGPVPPALAIRRNDDPPPDLAALEAAVLGRLQVERGGLARLREASRAVRAGLLASVMALEATFLYAYLRREDWASYPALRMGVLAGAFGLIGVALGWLALRPLYLPSLSRVSEMATLAGAMLFPCLLALLPALPTRPIGGFNYPGYAFRCFAHASCLALFVVLIGRALDRGGHGGRFAALATVVAGAYGGLLGLQLECPINDPVHLLTGHATVPAGLLVGMLLLRRM